MTKASEYKVYTEISCFNIVMNNSRPLILEILGSRLLINP